MRFIDLFGDLNRRTIAQASVTDTGLLPSRTNARVSQVRSELLGGQEPKSIAAKVT
jgi:hypothetical protein